MNVGVVSYRFDYYPYVRNIVGIVPGIEYTRVKDLFSRLNAGARWVNRVSRRDFVSTFDLNNQYFDFNLNHIDLLHLFNGVSYGRVPWVSTFETILPRLTSGLQLMRGNSISTFNRWKLEKALEAIAGERCKQLIALSGNSARFEGRFLETMSGYQKAVEPKTIILHPPQQVLVNSFDEKQLDLDHRIHFMFMGNSFFRKGGIEVLETLKMLREQYHYDFDLAVFSSFRDDGYAVPVDKAILQDARRMLEENREWVSYYSDLPNPQVLQIMRGIHVGLLPTYADTYGYTVIEFQAAGCPVITTNVRALPEINNNDAGWVIEVPTNELGEATYSTADGRQAISQAIRTGLEKAVHEIFHDRSLIRRKSEQSIMNIRSKHSPEEFALQLKAVYQRALGR